MGQQPGLDQRQENSSPETIDDGTDKSAVGGAVGRQESTAERHARIAEVAYRKAGARGFAPGGELEDWLAAEREVAADPRTRRLG
jgi:Protein of unknown function (DUF2934)